MCKYLCVYLSTCTSIFSPAVPVFMDYPHPAWVANGSSLTLHCSATGQPSPVITWLQDFQPLNTSNCNNNNSRVRLCSNGTLLIEAVEFSDAGFYTCVADNGFTSQVSVSVDVGAAPPETIGRSQSMCLINCICTCMHIYIYTYSHV